MATNNVTHLSGLAVGQLSSNPYTKGSAIGYMEQGSVTVNPGAIGAAATVDTSVSLANAQVGDSIIVTPPAAGLNSGLVAGHAWCSANGTVKIRIGNVTAGSITPSSASWTYMIISPNGR